MTGIDRVELAYLQQFLQGDAAVFGLVRSAVGWLLLERTGCQNLLKLAQGASPLPKADLLSRIAHRKDRPRAQAETAARRHAMARAGRPGLARLLRRLPARSEYFNIGHANLSANSLGALKTAGLQVTVMIHDTIPLDHPALARPDTVEPFRRKLAAVSAHADRIIHLSHATRATTERHLAALGRVPPGLVAKLGIDRPTPDPATVPEHLDLTSPFFVALGTIEPRKNHALLLDVWDQLCEPRPTLFILGNRGWAGADLLHRLDSLPKDGPVKVISGLSDGAVAALLSQATALLAPSLAEGFGLPPAEAASLGTPVVATDLAVTREILGNYAVYLQPSEIYSWGETVVRLANAPPLQPRRATDWNAPTWDEHFKKVLNLAC